MNTGGVLLAACGLSLLCVGTLFVLGFLAGRSYLLPVVETLLSSLRMKDAVGDEDAEDAPTLLPANLPSIDRSGSGRISAQSADSLDFDAAVARHRKGAAPARSSQGPAPLRASSQSAPAPRSTGLDANMKPMERHGQASLDSGPESLGGRRLRRSSGEPELDELHNYLEGEDEGDDFM